MKFLKVIVFFVFCVSGGAAMADSCSKEVTPLLNTLFTSLGNHCEAYVSLFAKDAQYYHQHDGYKTTAELQKNCQNYAVFCPDNECRFLQNGNALTVARGDSCQILVPYVWSEMPANRQAKENLEPHTGFEYLVVRPDRESPYGYRIQSFAELESSYSVAFNWADPEQTPDVVAQSTLRLLSLPNSASKGECNIPIAPVLTQYFKDKNNGGDVWRQQGDAVVLATGGVCQVSVPYSAQVGSKLKTGNFIFMLRPTPNNSYRVIDSVEFPKSIL